jgi:hypothetical protein
MRKIVRLTESDLNRLVKKVIREQRMDTHGISKECYKKLESVGWDEYEFTSGESNYTSKITLRNTKGVQMIIGASFAKEGGKNIFVGSIDVYPKVENDPKGSTKIIMEKLRGFRFPSPAMSNNKLGFQINTNDCNTLVKFTNDLLRQLQQMFPDFFA